MGIGVLIRVQMMDAVVPNPLEWSSLAGECPTKSQEIFQPLGSLKTAVGDKTVKSQSNSQTAGHPVEKESYTNCCPAKVTGKQGKHSSDVQSNEE
jgi:hypothetical protein